MRFRYAGKNDDYYPFDPFPHDGKLRLAQQYLTGNEHIPTIQDHFVVSQLPIWPACNVDYWFKTDHTYRSDKIGMGVMGVGSQATLVSWC